jgi:acylglycerol lipase
VFIQAIESIYSDLPKFAIGASLGGLLVYHISLRNPDRFTGVILVSAMIKPMVGSLLCTIAATISKLLPKVKCLAPIRGVATKNKNVSDDLEKDPDYYTGEVPANTYKLLLNALNDCSKTFANYTGNVLIIQGGIDKVVSPDGAFELLDKCQSKDKTVNLFVIAAIFL